MPFMKGIAPIRRTTEYLNSGKIIFRETVKIFSINYNTAESEHHRGAKEFTFWHLCQIQYKNPNVQCVTFKNLTPTPFIKIFFEDAKSVLIDIDSREKEEILDHLVNFTAVCKTEEELVLSSKISKQKHTPAYFGYGCKRHCICEIFGQVPCPSIVPLPDIWRGKGRDSSFLRKFRVPPRYTVPGLDAETENE